MNSYNPIHQASNIPVTPKGNPETFDILRQQADPKSKASPDRLEAARKLWPLVASTKADGRDMLSRRLRSMTIGILDGSEPVDAMARFVGQVDLQTGMQEIFRNASYSALKNCIASPGAMDATSTRNGLDPAFTRSLMQLEMDRRNKEIKEMISKANAIADATPKTGAAEGGTVAVAAPTTSTSEPKPAPAPKTIEDKQAVAAREWDAMTDREKLQRWSNSRANYISWRCFYTRKF